MAVFAFSEPQRLVARRASSKSLARRIFDPIIEARMAQAQRIVDEQIAISQRYSKPGEDRLGDMVVGKKGVYVWPF
jgi:hypothetical protein